MKRSPGWCRAACATVLACGMAGLAAADMEVAPQGAEGGVQARKRWQASPRAEGESRALALPEGERLIDRMVANPRFTAELGLTEETGTKLREEIKGVHARSVELDERVRKLSLEQADQLAKYLQSPDAGTNGLMKLSEDIGRERTEQAKLAIERLIVIHKYLTPEQIRKAHELLREHLKEREARGGAAAGAGRAERRGGTGKAGGKPDPAAPPPQPPEGW